MRPQTIQTTDTVVIQSELRLGEEGDLVVTTTVASHGNAKYTSIGLLHGGGDTWWVTERDREGKDQTIFVEPSKGDALEHYRRRAVAQAAQWAVS